MDVVIASECRYQRGANGQWVCPNGTFAYRFWQRYLEVFDRVIVVARCDQRQSVGTDVAGDGVSVLPLANSHGAWGALRQWPTWKQQTRGLLSGQHAFILRLPGQIGNLLATQLRRWKIPFGVEVVGDPAAVFQRGSFRHPLRPCLSAYFQQTLRRHCRQSPFVSYVTKRHLQACYPSSSQAFTTSYSSVDLPTDAFVHAARNYVTRGVANRLINVGTMSQRYKGQQDLIRAVELLTRRRIQIHLTLVGDGRFRPALERQVGEAKLTDRVEFLGQLPAGRSVQHALDRADLFVLSSHTEGLPRAVIEAQARALPCIATAVGGMSELVEPTEQVSPQDPIAMADRIQEILTQLHRMTHLSHTNLERAAEYSADCLQMKRNRLFTRLAAASYDHRSINKAA